KGRSPWTTLLSALGHRDDKEDDYDPLETLQARTDTNISADPAANAEQTQTVRLIEQALSRLPARHREACLLRYWEELDVAETAAAMGCSEGSVKTHCSRAVHALAEMLKARGVSLCTTLNPYLPGKSSATSTKGRPTCARARSTGCSRRG